MPLIPDWAVPSQNASRSLGTTPAPAHASLVASISRSSVPLSKCSAKRVQPMPTMATRSRIPCDAIRSDLLAAHRTSLPEVVGDAVRNPESAERHLDPHAYV